MNEEMMTYEIEELKVDNTEVDEETYVEPTGSGKGIVGAFVGGILVAGAASIGARLWNKTKDKREAAAVKKLEKKGYVVIKADDVIEDAIDAEVDSENEDETK